MSAETERKKPNPHSTGEEQEVYLYAHSGIQECHGVIPLWLKLVCIGLLIWSVYYMIRYWSVE